MTLKEQVCQLARDLSMPEPNNRTEARQLLGKLKRASGKAKHYAMLKAARAELKEAGVSSRQRAQFRIR